MEYTSDRGRHLRAGRALQIGEVPVLLQILAIRYDTNSKQNSVPMYQDFQKALSLFAKVVAVEEAVTHFPVTRDLLDYCAHCTKTLDDRVWPFLILFCPTFSLTLRDC